MKISYNFFNTLIEAKSASIKKSRPEADNQKLHYVKYYDGQQKQKFYYYFIFFRGNGPRIWCMLP